MAGMSEADVDNTRVHGWHRCEGCRCFIHSSIMCSVVCDGQAEPEYFCGHCHAVAELAGTPLAGDEDRLPDEDESSEDLLTKRGKPSGTQRGPTKPRKKQRCGQCNEFGHNKKTCSQSKWQRAHLG